MARTISIAAGAAEVQAEIDDSEVADAIWQSLPLSAPGNTWGDEIYFRIPVTASSDDLKEVVDFGDLAFWPPGNAFCIFFGLTPASVGDEIRPASAVAVFGRIVGDAAVLKQVAAGTTVTIAQA